MKQVAVAIDGPAGSGKSTVARRIADRIGALYIDTGAMYRAVALWALRNGIPNDQFQNVEDLAHQADIQFAPGSRRVMLNGEDVTDAIRSAEVTEASSRVAALPGVRKALVEKQREMAAASSVVMEGRDIGTVVLPGANVKVFLDAQATVRSGRRVRQLNNGGAGVDEEGVRREMAERDQSDRTRSHAPLVQAVDAVYLDSSAMSIEEVEEAILAEIRRRASGGVEKLS